MLTWFASYEIMMEMNTEGVEYVYKNTDRETVEKYRPIALSAIRHRKRFGGKRTSEHYDETDGYSMLDIPEDMAWISYDNAAVRYKKLAFVKTYLNGVVVGELQNDLCPLHVDSLIRECQTALF